MVTIIANSISDITNSWSQSLGPCPTGRNCQRVARMERLLGHYWLSHCELWQVHFSDSLRQKTWWPRSSWLPVWSFAVFFHVLCVIFYNEKKNQESHFVWGNIWTMNPILCCCLYLIFRFSNKNKGLLNRYKTLCILRNKSQKWQYMLGKLVPCKRQKRKQYNEHFREMI